MVAVLNGKTVAVEKESMMVTENILLTFSYHIDVDDVQKKTAMMQQIQSIVDQYKPVYIPDEEEDEMAE